MFNILRRTDNVYGIAHLQSRDINILFLKSRALSAWDKMNAKVIRKPQIGPLGRLKCKLKRNKLVKCFTHPIKDKAVLKINVFC